MSISDLVGATRLVAKLAEAKAWGNIAGLAALQVDARLLGLISRIQMRMRELESPRNMMRVIWAVAKVGLKNDEVEAVFTYIANVTPSRLHLFSSQELSNILWGLAKYCEMGSDIPEHHFSKRLALQVLG